MLSVGQLYNIICIPNTCTFGRRFKIQRVPRPEYLRECRGEQSCCARQPRRRDHATDHDSQVLARSNNLPSKLVTDALAIVKSFPGVKTVHCQQCCQWGSLPWQCDKSGIHHPYSACRSRVARSSVFAVSHIPRYCYWCLTMQSFPFEHWHFFGHFIIILFVFSIIEVLFLSCS